jgi:hypothetical protein
MALGIKKQLQEQACVMLFDAAKGVEGQTKAATDYVSALFQNGVENVPAKDFEAAKALVETALGEALSTLTEILQAGLDLKAGKLPD